MMSDYQAINYLDHIPYRAALQRSGESNLKTLLGQINKQEQEILRK